MKKQIFAVIFALAVSVVISAFEAEAQSNAIKVDIPFAFDANDRTLPAGTYMINSATDNRVVWRLENADHGPEVFLMAGNLSGTRDPNSARMTFRRYGNRHFLIGFVTPAYRVGLRRSSTEKKLQRAQNQLAENIEGAVETVSIR